MKRLCLTAILIVIITILASGTAEALWSGTFFWKDRYHDYAQFGVPDFDQKQDQWGKVDTTGRWRWTWCGPVAVLDSLWWMDSKYESVVWPNPVKPPAVSDHFGLLTSPLLTVDDHDPVNVDPYVQELATRMQTDGNCQWFGTWVWDMELAIDDWLWEWELHRDNHGDSKIWFWEETVESPTIEDLSHEIIECNDVIILLGFYYYVHDPAHPNGGYYLRHGGHYVCAAGVDPYNRLLGVSDPYLDTVAGDNGPSGPGRFGWPHDPVVHTEDQHNDADFLSHDIYGMGVLSDGEVWLVDYPWSIGWSHPQMQDIYENFFDVNPSMFFQIDADYVGDFMTKVEYKVAIRDNSFFWKYPYHDYAQAGVPDFDQKQTTLWGKQIAGGPWQWTWCGPVAVADCLWWLDSRFETLVNPFMPEKPPFVSDNFPLVWSYGYWDDHHANNVQQLVFDLGTRMFTDGDPYCSWAGTTVWDMQRGIDEYLWDHGVHKDNHPDTDYWFEEITVKDPTFLDIHEEVLKCHDLILLLGFYYWIDDPIHPSGGYYVRHGGHYVTVAGISCLTCTPWIAFSDPYLDTVLGDNGPSAGPGRFGWWHPLLPHFPIMHNDADFVSHDQYFVGELSDGEIWLRNYPWTLGPSWHYPDWYDFEMNFAEVNPVDWDTIEVDFVGPYMTKVEYKIDIFPYIYTFLDAFWQNGTFVMEWESRPGDQYELQYSDMFSRNMTWSVLATNIPSGGVTTLWTDGPLTPDVNKRFYRVRRIDRGEIETCDYTRDVVGWWAFSMRGGRNLVSTPFIPYNPDLNVVIGNQLTGSMIKFFSDTIEQWNPGAANYDRAWYDTTFLPGTWRDWSGGPPVFGFDEDVGYWITILPFNPQRGVFLAGKVATEARVIPVNVGRNMLGTCYPISVSLDDSNLVGSGFTGSPIKFFSDTIEWWNSLTANYDRVWYNTGLGQWTNWDNTPAIKMFDPGDGFWITVLPFNTAYIWWYPKYYIEPPN